VETYEGAGHAFLRQQDGREGANLRAAQKAWPRTVQFLKQAPSARTSLAAPALPVSLGGADFACVCSDELRLSEVAGSSSSLGAGRAGDLSTLGAFLLWGLIPPYGKLIANVPALQIPSLR